MPPSAPENVALSRETLAASTERTLRPASRAKPAIILANWAGRRVIVKDFSRNSWLLRQLYGRWVVRHESRIYARLAGVEGVPAFHGRLDAFAFAVDYVEGASLKTLPRKSLPPDVFGRLAALQRAIHARGVVHLDTHQSKNVLIAPDGRPCLVDFATSIYLGSNWLARRIFVPLMGLADRLGFHKLRVRYCAGLPAPAARRQRRLIAFLSWLWPPSAVRRLARALRPRSRK